MISGRSDQKAEKSYVNILSHWARCQQVRSIAANPVGSSCVFTHGAEYEARIWTGCAPEASDGLMIGFNYLPSAISRNYILECSKNFTVETVIISLEFSGTKDDV